MGKPEPPPDIDWRPVLYQSLKKREKELLFQLSEVRMELRKIEASVRAQMATKG